ncbi:GNAT family N-acetyltransferase [Algihabitans albus]|uniref:GNAT family N-acetyltransferase n=1 Tax=Algihabitans albus TaxID=2164067 RepID=UPI000E5D712F|nr:GNAT family N-acetyltransferase [Algihabitans albus]
METDIETPSPAEQLPRLETERLQLKQSAAADLDAMMALDSDPEVMRFIRTPITEDTQQDRLVQLVGRVDRDYGPGLGFWSVFPKTKPERFLGFVLLTILDGNSEVEIGWRFARTTWGKGYATEAAQAVLDYGFRDLALDPIVAVIRPGNRRSLAVAEKLGLNRDGTRKAYGKDLPFYRLNRSEWLAARERPAQSGL